MARYYIEVAAVFACSLGWLLLFGPQSPMSTEYGVCEAGAVRDVLAGNLILPSYDPGAGLQTRTRYVSRTRPPRSSRIPREGEWGPGGMVQVTPLYWWLAALGARTLGMGALALRLPSIIAAGVLCALLYGWTAVVLDRAVALFAVLIVMLCQYSIESAMAPRMDMLLAMFVTGGCFFLERALAPDCPRPLVLVWVAAVCIGLGSLAKGPIGAILPALVLGAYLLLRGRLRELFRPAPVLAFSIGFCLWLAWFALAYCVGGSDFFRYQIVEGIFRRALPAALGGAGSCRYPPYEYVQIVVGQCLPWSLFIPSLTTLIIVRRAFIPEPVLFSLTFFVAVFGFFTLSSGRCPVYVLPCVAPFAVLVGYLMLEMIRYRPELSSPTTLLFDSACCLTAISILLFATFTLLAAKYGVPAVVLKRLHPSDSQLLETVARLLPDHGSGLGLWLVATSIGAVAAVAGAVRSHPRWSVVGVLAISVASAFFWFHALAPEFSAQESFQGFAGQVDALVPREAVIEYVVRPPPCDLRFYLVHQVRPTRSVDPSPHEGFFLLREDDLGRLSSSERNGLLVLARSTNASPTLLAEFLVEGRVTPVASRSHGK